MNSFEIGDVVKVARKGVTGDKDGMGEGVQWENSWQPSMDCNIGITFTIRDIDAHGAWFDEFDSDNLHGGYGYPLNVLEPVLWQ